MASNRDAAKALGLVVALIAFVSAVTAKVLDFILHRHQEK